MRIWNLSSFSELEPPVMERHAISANQSKPRPSGAPRTQSMKVAMRVAALAVASIPLTTGTGSSSALSIPRSAVVHNADQRPPLESVFKNRFKSGWTKERETSLLEKIAAGVGKGSADEVANLAHSLQQEKLSGVPRLEPNEVQKLIRRKV